jgi:hypothetical protein
MLALDRPAKARINDELARLTETLIGDLHFAVDQSLPGYTELAQSSGS